MRSPAPLTLLAATALLAAACSPDTNSDRRDGGAGDLLASPTGDGAPGGDLAAAPPHDLAAAPDLGDPSCIGLDECACFARGDCRVISDSCWCPFPACGNGACVCGGGNVLGCAPESSACQAIVSCNPAGRRKGPSSLGCFACEYSNDCKIAFLQMMDTLKQPPCGLSETIVSAFSCDKNPTCLTKCVNDVKACDDVGCGLCAACGCGKLGPFEQCVYDCWK